MPQPTCRDPEREGKLVEKSNVNPGYDSNLCKKQPHQHSTDGSCQWDQGQGVRGAHRNKVQTLYAHSEARYDPFKLFLNLQLATCNSQN
jgi:hypothetical protein